MHVHWVGHGSLDHVPDHFNGLAIGAHLTSRNFIASYGSSGICWVIASSKLSIIEDQHGLSPHHWMKPIDGFSV